VSHLSKSTFVDLKSRYTYGNALESLKKYPLPLETGKDCRILKGFGAKLCQMLDQKLKNPQNVPKTVNFEEEILLKPNSFDIVLCVDNNETSG